MPQDATCPGCKHIFPVTEARQPFTVPCPKCDTELTVEFKKPATTPEAGQPPFDLLVKPGSLPESATQIAPEKKRKGDDDDDPKRKGGSAMIVFLSGGFGLLFVLGGLALTGWYLFTQIDYETTSTYYNRPNNNPGWPNNPGGGNRPGGGNPGGGNPGGGNNPPPKKDWFELKPVTGTPSAISPPSLPSEVSNLELDGKVGQLAVGGGGRYIVMHFPDKGQLSVFDVNTARIKSVPADNGDVLVAAGLTKVVTYVSGNIFRVYTLPNLDKQYDASAPGGVHGMAMGSRTNGPMLTVGVFGRVALYDIFTDGIKEVEASAGEPGVHWHQKGVRALPDGSAFSTHDGFRGGQNTILLTVQSRKWKVSADTFAAPFPGQDGHFYGNGVVIDKSYKDQKFGGIGAGSGQWFLPSVSSKDYYLKLVPTTTGKFPKEKRYLEVSVHKGKNSAATTVLTEQPEFEGFVDRFSKDPAIVFDQHLFLIPEAKVLVTLNKDRNRLVLRKLDL